MKRIIGVLLASAALLFVGASPAFAHGEESQEAWLRLNSVGWMDVQFSGGTPQSNGDVWVNQGDEFKITGTAKILETWPRTLGAPTEGFINVVSPGPVILVKNRVINGVQAPHSIYINKGGVYNFELTLQARIPGRYHIHPSFAVHGAGTLIGPGQWYEVRSTAAGFTNPVTLYNGTTVNLENYKVWWIFGFTFVGFIIGMVWLLWWIWPKPTVSRLAITSQLSVNDDGGDAVGLVTKRDHRAMDAIMLVTVLFVAIGMIWQSVAYPTKIPLQVDRFAIAGAPQPVPFATAAGTEITLDNKTNTYAMKVNLTATGTNDVTINAVHMANITLTPVTGDVSLSPNADVPAGQVAISPSAVVPAGQTVAVTLRLPRAYLDSLKLIPVQNANSSVAGVLELSSGGETQFETVYGEMNTLFA
jgi:methane/ammonia monooxygenase subunit B